MEVIETHEELSTPQPAVASPAASQSAAEPSDSAPRRALRQTRHKVVTYNVQILAGTAIHTPTKYLEKHHENVVHGDIQAVAKGTTPTPPKKRMGKRRAKSVSNDFEDPAEQQLAVEAAQAAQRRTSSRFNNDLRRVALGNSSGVGEAVASTISAGKKLVQNALKRSASDSRLRSSFRSQPSKFKEDTSDDDEEQAEEEAEPEEPEYFKPKTKQWLKQGLFVGQERGFDARFTEKRNRARREARQGKENKVLPLPMFATEIQLESNPRIVYKAFKLPFDVYNPLPKKVKVDGWVKLNRSEYTLIHHPCSCD